MESRLITYILLVNIGGLISIMNYSCVIANELNVQVFNNYMTVNPISIWRSLDTSKEVVQNFFTTIQEKSIDKIKCSTYCITSNKLMDTIPYNLNLIWNLNIKQKFDIGSTAIFDKEFNEILQEKLAKSNNSQNLQSKCMLSIINRCQIPEEFINNISEKEKKFINNLQPNFDVLENSSIRNCPSPYCVNEKLVNQTNLTNETEISFNVRRYQKELNAVVLGNLSKIDLKMPIATTQKAPQLTLVTTRMPDGTAGLRLNVLGPPLGGWHIKFFGVNNERYKLIVTSTSDPKLSPMDMPPTYFTTGKSIKTRDLQNIRFNVTRMLREIQDFNKNTDILNPLNNRKSASRKSDEYSSDIQNDQIAFKFPKVTDKIKVEDIDNNATSQFDAFNVESRMIDRESFETDDLSRSINEQLPIKKTLIVEINPNTNLIASPGTNHLVTFDITNNHILTVRHYFTYTSSPFIVIATIPPYRFVEIGPGQTIGVTLVIQIPSTNTHSVSNTVTLQVQGVENLEKTAKLQVLTLGSTLYDDVSPTIHHQYNNNCAGRTNPDKCLKSYWSVDITIQDSDSGLKSVTSVPKGAYSRYQYISGTSNAVKFYYSNNCCNHAVEIIATDVAGNIYSKKIYVQEWYNLVEGEIAAIILGVLFIIVFIILIILISLYCSHQKKSHNLTFSQRYGSRSTPRNE